MAAFNCCSSASQFNEDCLPVSRSQVPKSHKRRVSMIMLRRGHMLHFMHCLCFNIQSFSPHNAGGGSVKQVGQSRSQRHSQASARHRRSTVRWGEEGLTQEPVQAAQCHVHVADCTASAALRERWLGPVVPTVPCSAGQRHH